MDLPENYNRRKVRRMAKAAKIGAIFGTISILLGFIRSPGFLFVSYATGDFVFTASRMIAVVAYGACLCFGIAISVMNTVELYAATELTTPLETSLNGIKMAKVSTYVVNGCIASSILIWVCMYFGSYVFTIWVPLLILFIVAFVAGCCSLTISRLNNYIEELQLAIVKQEIAQTPPKTNYNDTV